MNQKQPIFKETREKLNDSTYNSGGSISDHPELVRAKIDPEKTIRAYYYKAFLKNIQYCHSSVCSYLN